MSIGSKRIEIDGKFYRMREGKLVQIPTEWVGIVTHPQTIKKKGQQRQPRQKI